MACNKILNSRYVPKRRKAGRGEEEEEEEEAAAAPRGALRVSPHSRWKTSR